MHVLSVAINLDRRPDRMRSIVGEFDRPGLEATRVPAVDARNLTDDRLRMQVNWDTGHRRRALDRAEVACTLGHLRAMGTFLSAEGTDAALILGGDAKLANDLPVFVGNVDWWPKNAELVKIETQDRKQYRVFGPECRSRFQSCPLRRILLWTPAPGGYLPGRRAASDVSVSCGTATDSTDRIPFDFWLSEIARRLRPVQVLPGLVRRRRAEFESDLDHVRNENPRTGGSRRLRRYLTVTPREAFVKVQLLSDYTGRMPMEFAHSRHAA